MRMANRSMCAVGIILAALGGCTLPEQFGLSFLQTSGPAENRVVVASLETVARSTQSGLERLGMNVIATPQGEDLRLTARTSVGDQFNVVLTRVKNSAGEQTRVRIEGGNNSHHQSVFRILAELELANKR
jgi:hypothetical protein